MISALDSQYDLRAGFPVGKITDRQQIWAAKPFSRCNFPSPAGIFCRSWKFASRARGMLLTLLCFDFSECKHSNFHSELFRKLNNLLKFVKHIRQSSRCLVVTALPVTLIVVTLKKENSRNRVQVVSLLFDILSLRRMETSNTYYRNVLE